MRLHAHVLPHLPDPLLLTDFLTHALDGGGLNGAPPACFQICCMCMGNQADFCDGTTIHGFIASQ